MILTGHSHCPSTTESMEHSVVPNSDAQNMALEKIGSGCMVRFSLVGHSLGLVDDISWAIMS